AEKFLKKNGYKILHRNWRARYAELDIVALKNKIVIFVEVKTMRQGGKLRPEDNVDYFKQKKLLQSAKLYLVHNKIKPDMPWQIDVVAITIGDNDEIVKLNHLTNAVFE
ncbi:MAG: hypothetical protein COU81_00875, partial [Candidatus Portnoybacteria bacterium CG10_big_fil_rev_8_21_14_0_10_36_7]